MASLAAMWRRYMVRRASMSSDWGMEDGVLLKQENGALTSGIMLMWIWTRCKDMLQM